MKPVLQTYKKHRRKEEIFLSGAFALWVLWRKCCEFHEKTIEKESFVLHKVFYEIFLTGCRMTVFNRSSLAPYFDESFQLE